MVEAQTLAKLSHPNVVMVYAVSEWEGGVFFVMEFVDGMNGQDWLKQHPSWREVLDVFIDAGQGLAVAHDKGIQHGDFKPANILIGSDGRTRVADFGIADYLHVDDGDEQPAGRRAGTPEYMAPERLRGHRGDARSDQYSFCVSLWTGLHGSRPFRGKTALQLLAAIEDGEIHPRELDARVPRWLTEVVRKGLDEDPDQRYRDMTELLRALKGGPDDESRADDLDDDDDVFSIAHEGPVLHVPATLTGAAPQRWGYFAVAGLSSLVVLGVTMLTSSPAPELAAGIVEAEAHTVILGLVAADRTMDARQMWSSHASELSDEQSLQIARDWLTRARQQAPGDRTKAEQMAAAAREVAEHVEHHGTASAAKKLASQLATEATIYERIAADEFADAQQAWSAHETELTGAQSLQLAGDFLKRAEQLTHTDRGKACVAVLAAREFASNVETLGASDELKERGGQLAADVTAFLVDHPDVCADKRGD